MKKSKKPAAGLLLVVLMVLSLVLTVPFSASADIGTTYYLDSTSGKDTNSGTSPDSAWQTLNKVNSVTFGPGDTILLRRGCIWVGTLYPKGSGSADGRITIDAYGIGNLPLINGNEVYYTASDPIDAAVYLNNQSYITIRNLEVINDSRVLADRAGIHINATSAACTDITIENNKIHNVAGNGDDSNHGEIGALAIRPRGYKQMMNVLVQNNEIYATGSTGILASAGGNGTTPTNMIVRNNYLHDIGGDGILVINCESPLVEYNIVAGSHTRSSQYCAGIWPFNCDNAVIQYNEAYDTRTTIDGQGFDSDYQCRNSLFQYNYGHDNQGGFFLICCETSNWDGGPSWNDGTVIRYNIGQNNARSQFSLVTKITNTTIYNNTIYLPYASTAEVVTEYSKNNKTYPDNTKFYNNIFYNIGYGGYNIPNCTNTEWDYNLFFGNHPYNEPEDPHKLTSDPQFIRGGSAGSGRDTCDGYQLNSLFPAIGSGKLIENNGGLDFFGNVVSAVSLPNRGAYNGAGIAGTTTTYPQRQYITVDPIETSVSYDQWGVGTKNIIALSSEETNPNTGSTKSMKVSFLPKSTGAVQMHTGNSTIITAIKNASKTLYPEGMRMWMKFTEGTPSKFKGSISLFSNVNMAGVNTVYNCGKVAPDADGWVTLYFGNFGNLGKLTNEQRTAFFASLTSMEINFDATTGVTSTVYIDDIQLFGTTTPPPTVPPTTTFAPNSNTIYECEILSVTASEGDSQGNLSNPDANAGNVNALTCNSVGDYVEYTIPSIAAAQYTVKTRVMLGSDKGIYQLSVNGTNVGEPIDCYNSGNLFGVVTLGTATITTTGPQTFRFTVTGKNAGSTGVNGAFDYIWLITPAATENVTSSATASTISSITTTPSSTSTTPTTTPTTSTTTTTITSTTTVSPPTTTITTSTTVVSTTTSLTGSSTVAFFTNPYLTDSSYLWGIHPQTNSIDNFLSAFGEQAPYSVTVSNHNEPITSGLIGTGYTVDILKNGMSYEQYTAIIYGDLDGDGAITAIDLLCIKKHLLKLIPLSGHSYIAANTDRGQDGVVGASDMLKLKKHLLGMYSIKQT